MLLSPAKISMNNCGDASELISFKSIKPTFVLDIWTVEKVKSNDTLIIIGYM